MPNYSLQINNDFKPFSFKEMLMPWLMYKQGYEDTERALADLGNKADVWGNMINKDVDPELYQLYENISNEISNQADVLATSGLNPAVRKAAFNLNRQYAKDIVPIENAYNTRKEQETLQLTESMKNPSLIFSRKASETGLLPYVQNPALSFDTINGSAVADSVYKQAQALSKELVNDKGRLEKLVGGDYYAWIEKRGFNSEDVLEAIRRSPTASPVLTEIVENAVNATGVKSWNNQDAEDKTYYWANQGLWGAVGQTDAKPMVNWRAQENLSHSHNMTEINARGSSNPRNNPYLIPFKSKDGNGYFYNPQYKVWLDKDGNLSNTPEDAPDLSHLTKGKEEAKVDLSGVGTIEGWEDAGYKIAGASFDTKDGWKTYADDEDIAGYRSIPSYFDDRWSVGVFWNASDAGFKPSAKEQENLTLQWLDKSDDEFYDLFFEDGAAVTDEDVEKVAKGDLSPLSELGKTQHKYIQSRLGIREGLGSDRIEIVKANTPEDGRFDYVIMLKQ